jgi:serine phosphatase RsbU (regulator of sigma subunit)/CHASE3 domain sensor protein
VSVARGARWYALLFAAAIVIVALGGLWVRKIVDASFTTATYVRAARLEDFRMQTLQLDEETGIRGYAVTGDKSFLEPFTTAQPQLKRTIERLDLHMREVHIPEIAVLDDARATNELWLKNVAARVLAGDPHAVQREGKKLVDHFRVDVATINTALLKTEVASDGATRDGIAQITLLTIVSMVAIALAGWFIWIVRARSLRRLLERDREAMRLRAAYEGEKRVADALTDAFLQKRLPSLTGVSFSATYVPAREERKVGGDWYEGVELTEGRVMFAIGDVAGHGLDAAASMNSARQALIAAALVYQDPARMLQRVNDELLLERGRMVTAVVGIADAKRFAFSYAAAGHPPPVLVEPGRAPRVLACGGVPLGVLGGDHFYRTSVVQTVPGAMLVLYTDGAVEHTRDPIEGERILVEAVRTVAEQAPSDPAGAIRELIFSGREADDDVAILTISFVESERGMGEVSSSAQVQASGSLGGLPPSGTIGQSALRRRAA